MWMWPEGQPSLAHSDLGSWLLPGFELVSDLLVAVSKLPLVLNSFSVANVAPVVFKGRSVLLSNDGRDYKHTQPDTPPSDFL